MRRLIAILFLMPMLVQAQRTVMVDSNGVITYPTNFFTSNDIATVTYVDGFVSAVGAQMYFYGSTNGNPEYQIEPTNALFRAYDMPSLGVAVTNDITVLSNDHYCVSYVSTQTWSYVLGGIAHVELWAFETSPGGASLAAEFYVSNDKTNLIELGASVAQVVPSTLTRLEFTVAVATTNLGTNSHFVTRLKSSAVTLTPTIQVVTEGNYDSHMAFPVPAVDLTTKLNVTNSTAQVAFSVNGDFNVASNAVVTNTLTVWGGLSSQGSIPGTFAERFGQDAISTGVASIALGNTATATNDYAVALGSASKVGGYKGIAIGDSANSQHYASVALGANSLTTASNQITMGVSNTEVRVLGPMILTNTGAAGTQLAIWSNGQPVVIVTNGAIGIGSLPGAGYTLYINGLLYSSGYVIGSDNTITWLGRLRLRALSDGVFSITDNGGSAFTRLILGTNNVGAGSVGYPAIGRSSAGLTLTDQAGTFTSSNNLTLGGQLYLYGIGLTNYIPGTDQAMLYASTNNPAGIAEMYVVDESGNQSLISPHAKDAPASLYDSQNDNVTKEVQLYLGTVTWKNLDRATTLAPMTDAEKTVLIPAQRVCRIVESFDDYKLRTGITLPKMTWASVQAARQIEYDNLRATELARIAAGETNVIARPARDIKKPEPEFLKAVPK